MGFLRPVVEQSLYPLEAGKIYGNLTKRHRGLGIFPQSIENLLIFPQWNSSAAAKNLLYNRKQ